MDLYSSYSTRHKKLNDKEKISTFNSMLEITVINANDDKTPSCINPVNQPYI